MFWDIYVFFANCGHGEGDFQNSEKNIFEMRLFGTYVLFENLDNENHLEDVSVCKR